jgi:hypothetical protein
MSNKKEIVVKKRFVISRGLLGKGVTVGVTVKFTDKKGDTYEYDHDEVYATNQEKLLSMACFNEYGNYTKTNGLPSWAK